MEATHEKLSQFQYSFAGGAAGAFTRAIAHPLDVIKIRFQLQLEPIRIGSKYSSITQAAYSIISDEGMKTLWSGHIPAQFLSICFGVIQFSTFESLAELSYKKNHDFSVKYKHSINFCCGAVAATIATVATFPLDTLRTRLVAERKTEKVYKGALNAFITMLKNEGSNSLFKGILPTLVQVAPNAGIQFATYRLFTNSIFTKIPFFHRGTSETKVVELTIIANLIAGSMAGIAAKFATYPFDLMKKRMQIQGFQQYRKSFGKQMYCNGVLDCVKLTVVEEGFLALYKGLGPSLIKAVLVSALNFAIYDEIRLFFLKLSR